MEREENVDDLSNEELLRRIKMLTNGIQDKRQKSKILRKEMKDKKWRKEENEMMVKSMVAKPFRVASVVEVS